MFRQMPKGRIPRISPSRYFKALPTVVSARRGSLVLATILASGALAGPSFAETATISLVTGALPPITSAPGHPGFAEELAKRTFARIGVPVEITNVPVERSGLNASSGIDDGVLIGMQGIERVFPNLVKVPEKLLDFEFVAYARRSDIVLHDWADLRPYAVAYATGWKVYEWNVKDVKELTKTPSIRELFPLLENGRADVVLADRWQAQFIVRAGGYEAHLVEPPLARGEMYMFLNKKHADLAERIGKVLAEMKADGSYQELYDKYLKFP
jgi:polar amino acid transport system substrate-binding protein